LSLDLRVPVVQNRARWKKGFERVWQVDAFPRTVWRLKPCRSGEAIDSLEEVILSKADAGQFPLLQKSSKPERFSPGVQYAPRPKSPDRDVSQNISRHLLTHSPLKDQVEASLGALQFLEKYDTVFGSSGGRLVIGPGAPTDEGGILVMWNVIEFDGSRRRATLAGRTDSVQSGVVFAEFPSTAGMTYRIDLTLGSSQMFDYQLWQGPIFGETGGQGTDLTKFVGQAQASPLNGHIYTVLTAPHDGFCYVMLTPSSREEAVPWVFFQCEVIGL
jgi:hypothetical protein